MSRTGHTWIKRGIDLLYSGRNGIDANIYFFSWFMYQSNDNTSSLDLFYIVHIVKYQHNITY